MAKCAFCRSRKGKRSCPSLTGPVCSACCGAHRGREIRCPMKCRYLQSESPYDGERAFGQLVRGLDQVLDPEDPERAQSQLTLLYVIAGMVTSYDRLRERLDDQDVLDGLGAARRRLSPLVLPETSASASAESLAEEIADFVEKKGLAREAADALLAFLERRIPELSPRPRGGRRFLGAAREALAHWAPDVAARLEKSASMRRSAILPGSEEILET